MADCKLCVSQTLLRLDKEGGRFIAPDSAEIARILARHDFLKPITAPAGGYPGQTAALGMLLILALGIIATIGRFIAIRRVKQS